MHYSNPKARSPFCVQGNCIKYQLQQAQATAHDIGHWCRRACAGLAGCRLGSSIVGRSRFQFGLRTIRRAGLGAGFALERSQRADVAGRRTVSQTHGAACANQARGECAAAATPAIAPDGSAGHGKGAVSLRHQGQEGFAKPGLPRGVSSMGVSAAPRGQYAVAGGRRMLQNFAIANIEDSASARDERSFRATAQTAGEVQCQELTLSFLRVCSRLRVGGRHDPPSEKANVPRIKAMPFSNRQAVAWLLCGGGGCNPGRSHRNMPQSGNSARRQAWRFSMRVQIRHDMCHNLLHQVGEENKSPIATTAQAV